MIPTTPDSICIGLTQTRYRGRFVRYLFYPGVLAAGIIVGCVSDPPPKPDVPIPSLVWAPDGTRFNLTARLLDVPPAVSRVMTKVEMAVLHQTGSPEDGFMRFELIGARNETAELRIDFNPTSGLRSQLREERELVGLTRLIPASDSEREKQIVQFFANELDALKNEP